MELEKVLVVMFCGVSFIQVSGTVLRQERNGKDLTDESVHESIKTNQTVSNLLSTPGYKPGLMIKLPFAGSGCNCLNKTCSCCAAISVIGFDRQACAVLTYAPSQVVSFDVLVNNTSPNRSTFSNKSKGPKQSCVPILPVSPLGPVDFCVGLFGITFTENKLHVCMNMMTRVSENPVLHLKLDCLDMDLEGANLTQPGNVIDPANAVPADLQTTQPAIDVFDPVTERATTTL